MGNFDCHRFIREIILFKGAIFIKALWIPKLIVLLSAKVNSYIINTLCACLLLRITMIVHHIGILVVYIYVFHSYLHYHICKQLYNFP